MNHRPTSRLIHCIWLCVLLAACTANTPPAPTVIVPTVVPATPSRPSPEETLRLLYWQAPTTLNPHLTGAVRNWEAGRIAYEPLATYDKNNALVPILAAEIPSLENGQVAADYRSVTWKLKPGVQWSDGQPFAAADVRFTWQFAVNPDVKAASASIYEPIADVEVVDPTTVRVVFKEPTLAWAVPFVGLQGVILPQHIFEPYANADAANAGANMITVGTGAYQAVSFRNEEVLFLGNQTIQTNRFVFEPNKHYREQGKPFFRRIELKGGGTALEAARLVLESGDYDFSWGFQAEPAVLQELEAKGRGRIVTNFEPRVERIALNRSDPRTEVEGERSSANSQNPFFSDLRVRQAFAYALDRETIAALYGAYGRAVGNNLVAPEEYVSPHTFYPYNLNKAEELLDEAGWLRNGSQRFKDGVPLRVVFTAYQDPVVQDAQEVYAHALRQIGIDTDIQPVDVNFFYSNHDKQYNFQRFEADMQQLSIRSPIVDPAIYLGYWTCTQIPQKNNSWSRLNTERWCNADYDARYTAMSSELDPVKRQALVIELNDMLIDDVVMIPLVQLARVSGVSNEIQGVDFTPWDSSLWNIQDWRRETQ